MKVAVLGGGTMGSFHARTLRELPQVREVAIFDTAPGRGGAATLEEALTGAAAVIVATPATTHAEMVRTVARRGLPVFCEKPLALDLADAVRLVRELESAQTIVQLGFQRRFDPAFVRARDALAGGAVGRVHAFALATFDRTPPPREYVPASGGLFKDMHIHDFDTIRWLFGREAVEVAALGSVRVDPFFGDLGDVDTSALAIRLDDGSLGTIAGARANAAGYIARLDVYGAAAMHSVREDRPYRDFLDRYPDAYRREIEEFVRVARGEAPVACTARDGLEALRLAEAAATSARERRPVALAEVAALE